MKIPSINGWFGGSPFRKPSYSRSSNTICQANSPLEQLSPPKRSHSSPEVSAPGAASQRWHFPTSFCGNTMPYGTHMEVSWNGGTPKSSILMGLSVINHPFWGNLLYGNPHIIDELSTSISWVEKELLVKIRPLQEHAFDTWGLKRGSSFCGKGSNQIGRNDVLVWFA